jgi:hypothetical protein
MMADVSSQSHGAWSSSTCREEQPSNQNNGARDPPKNPELPRVLPLLFSRFFPFAKKFLFPLLNRQKVLSDYVRYGFKLLP